MDLQEECMGCCQEAAEHGATKYQSARLQGQTHAMARADESSWHVLPRGRVTALRSVLVKAGPVPASRRVHRQGSIQNRKLGHRVRASDILLACITHAL